MTQTESNDKPESNEGKGKTFFERAEKVAETGNWDSAIELYLEGIKRGPENVERGHQPLRETALKRKVQGGKSAGVIEQIKRKMGKTPLDNLLNGQYLLSKDPGSVAAMMQVLKAARAINLKRVMRWVANIVLESQKQASKPSKQILVNITDAFKEAEDYVQAIQACEMAYQLTPDDGKLHQLLGELSAKYTIKQGGYEDQSGGDFTKNIKDMDKQKELSARDAMVQDKAYLAGEVEKARGQYKQSPDVPGKINALVDALLKIEDDASHDEAVEVLADAYSRLKSYQFKMRIGEIKIHQMTSRYRSLVEAGKKDQAREQLKKQLEFELQEYTERSENYPTDLGIKFELGRRQFIAGKFDESIASFQQAQREPRRRPTALNYLGQAFAKKQWDSEAVDTFDRALEGDLTEERSKDLLYNLGCALEKMGQLDRAQTEFSRVAQIDYNYKDVRKRLDEIRKGLDRQKDQDK